MMEYFRRFLIFLRTADNKDDSNPTFSAKLLIGTLIGVILGIITDTLLPFNFITNMIRGVIANISALAMFSFLYLYDNKASRSKINSNKHYKPLRKRLSYKQRLNLSISIGTITAAFVLFSGNPSPIYTLKAIGAIAVTLGLIAFARKDRNEFLKTIYEIPDVRDMQFDLTLQAEKEIKAAYDKEQLEKKEKAKEEKAEKRNNKRLF